MVDAVSAPLTGVSAALDQEQNAAGVSAESIGELERRLPTRTRARDSEPRAAPV
jgi:hypothetical protein